MTKEEEFSTKLETLEQLTTKVYIHDTKYRMDSVKTQVAINGIKTDIDHLLGSVKTQPTINDIKTYIDDLLVGSITAFAMKTPPEGWLVCDGTEVSRTKFARLFERVGETFGNGNGSTTFNLPDLRGVSLRGWSVEGIRDSGRKFGSYQSDQIQSHTHIDSGHTHSGKTSKDGKHKHDLKDGDIDDHDEGDEDALLYSVDLEDRESHDDDYIRNDGEHSHNLKINQSQAVLGDPMNSYTGAGEIRHGNETRVKNVALLYCIKY